LAKCDEEREEGKSSERNKSSMKGTEGVMQKGIVRAIGSVKGSEGNISRVLW